MTLFSISTDDLALAAALVEAVKSHGARYPNITQDEVNAVARALLHEEPTSAVPEGQKVYVLKEPAPPATFTRSLTEAATAYAQAKGSTALQEALQQVGARRLSDLADPAAFQATLEAALATQGAA